MQIQAKSCHEFALSGLVSGSAHIRAPDSAKIVRIETPV
jgi:hypothetical protein